MNGGDTMENKRTEMTSGGAGYGMAIRAGQRSGKMQELLDVLRERCEELERERENLLILCDQLKRDNERGEIELLAEADWGQQRRDERDEARQWANHRTATANKLYKEIANLRQLMGSVEIGPLPNGAIYEGIVDGMHQFYEQRDGIICRCGTGMDNAAMTAMIADRATLLSRIDNMALDLHIAENQLEKELGKMRERCEKAEAEREQFRQFGITMSDGLASCAGAENAIAIANRERDKARQWAAKLYKENADLEATLALCRSAGHEISDIGFDALAENTSLRAQLAEARNKALGEADRAVFKAMRAMWRQSIGVDVTRYVRTAVCALKNSGAYPADEISTVADNNSQLADARIVVLNEAIDKCMAVKAGFLEEEAGQRAVGAAACAARLVLLKYHP